MSKYKFEPYFKGTNFGSQDYEALVLEGLMKITCGFSNGFTLENIIIRMGFARQIYLERGLSLTREGEQIMYKLYEDLVKKKNPVKSPVDNNYRKTPSEAW